jgi:fructokinase
MITNWPEVVCLGEALIDLVSLKAGVGLDGAPGFRKAAGGAPANVAVGVARLGRGAAFVGAVGDDPFGVFLREEIARHGVNVAGVARISQRLTALALVSLKADGDRDFLFYGDRPAHLGLRLSGEARSLLRRARIIHYGSISLIADPARRATLSAIRQARRSRLCCSYDPNLRLSLWPNARTARRWMWEGLQHANCVKVNEEELAFLTGSRSTARGLRALVAAGPRLAVVTLGGKGCAYCGAAGEGLVPGFAVKVVDTTGAGDAFVAGMLVGLLERSPDLGATLLDTPALESVLRFAHAAAALSTERRGGIPSLPSRRQVAHFLRSHGLRAATPDDRE